MSIPPGGRIFWLGMHVVLNATELPRLRQLGYEVYNPPYNADVYDQSAETNWDRDQPTTLPKLVFDTLSATNFFYSPIPPLVAEILNAYFDTVIVTINADWLREVLKVYRGRVIYRTYGQTGDLATMLAERNCWRDIQEREDFHFLPFCAEVIEEEQDWLRDRARIVPYMTLPDVFEHADEWQDMPKLDQIMVNVPNIHNAYYRNMYNHLNARFPESFYRFYGVQRFIVEDRRVAGTLQRSDLLDAYRRSRGFFYPYHDRNVCYLQPIEMMAIGGPVVYHTGCLLDRFMQHRGPGRAATVEEQARKNRWMRAGDRDFVEDVIASQAEVRARYSGAQVLPIFDATFRELLGPAAPRAATLAFTRHEVGSAAAPGVRPRLWVLAHFPGAVFRHLAGHAFASEGIPRVIARTVRSMAGSMDIVLTTYRHSLAAMVDMFRDLIEAGTLSIQVLEGTPPPGAVQEEAPWQQAVVEAIAAIRGGAAGDGVAADVALRFDLVGRIEADPRCAAVFVPHYYLFPEALSLTRPFLLYLPDYTPAFFPGVAFARSLAEDAANARIGAALAARARLVLTNSEFTRGYLGQSPLKVPPEKIRVAPMPLLVGEAPPLGATDREALEQALGGVPYLLYPTANRPNKNIAFLLRVFAAACARMPDLRLVLTCSLDDFAPARAAYEQLQLGERVVFQAGVSESRLKWLYENAAALCLTSTMEGNFPPQILEAMHYGVPVVTTDLPQIREILGDQAGLLRRCMPLSEADFLAQLEAVLAQPEAALAAQREAAAIIAAHGSPARFAERIGAIFAETAAAPPAGGLLLSEAAQ